MQARCPGCGAPRIAHAVECGYCRQAFQPEAPVAPQGAAICVTDFRRSHLGRFQKSKHLASSNVDLVFAPEAAALAVHLPKKTDTPILNLLEAHDDVVASVRVAFPRGLVAEQPMTLALAARGSVDTSYRLCLWSTGSCSLAYRGANNEMDTLFSVHRHPDFLPDAFNELRFVAKDDKLRGYLNGVLLGSARDTRLQRGFVSVWAGGMGTPVGSTVIYLAELSVLEAV